MTPCAPDHRHNRAITLSAIPEPFTFIPEDQRSIALPDGSITSPFLDLFGRPPRDTGLRIRAQQPDHRRRSACTCLIPAISSASSKRVPNCRACFSPLTPATVPAKALRGPLQGVAGIGDSAKPRAVRRRSQPPRAPRSPIQVEFTEAALNLEPIHRSPSPEPRENIRIRAVRSDQVRVAIDVALC